MARSNFLLLVTIVLVVCASDLVNAEETGQPSNLVAASDPIGNPRSNLRQTEAKNEERGLFDKFFTLLKKKPDVAKLFKENPGLTKLGNINPDIVKPLLTNPQVSKSFNKLKENPAFMKKAKRFAKSPAGAKLRNVVSNDPSKLTKENVRKIGIVMDNPTGPFKHVNEGFFFSAGVFAVLFVFLGVAIAVDN